MFKNIAPLSKVAVILIALLIALVLVLLPRACEAQANVPYVKELCPEAVEYKIRYEKTKRLLDSTRIVGDQMIKEADRDAAADLKRANVKIQNLSRDNSQKDEDIATQVRETTKQIRRADEAEKALADQKAETARVQAELDKERPRTLLGKAWRGLGIGFKYIGIAAVAAGGTVFALTR